MIGLTPLIYREWTLFFRSKLEIGFTLLLPLVLLFFFSVNMNGVVGKINGVPYLGFVIPGIAVMTLLNSTLNTASRVFNEGFSPMLLELFSYPSSRNGYVLSKLVSATALASLQALIFLLGGFIVFGYKVSFMSTMTGIGILIVTAIGLSGLSLSLAMLTKDMGSFLVLNNLLGQILIWTSTIFYPLESMPPILRFIGLVNPITHASDILRSIFLSNTQLEPWSWIYLIVFAAICGFIAIRLLAQRAAKAL